MRSGTATVHVGPKGGTEYRLWTGEDTYRVVGRYKALPLMDEAERVKADGMERARKDARAKDAADAATWRAIRSGRTEGFNG